MKIIYLGPSRAVNVAPYGPHARGEVKDYPDEFGEELLATSKKQRFKAVEDGPGSLESMTVQDLRAALEAQGVKIPAGAKKADLLALMADSE